MNQLWLGFGSTLEWERLVPLIVDRTVEAIGAEAGSLWLRERGTDRITCVRATGTLAPHVQGTTMMIADGVVGAVVATGEARFVPDISLEPDFSGELDRRSGFLTRSLLVAAVRGQGSILGAIEVLNKRGEGGGQPGCFTLDDLDLLITVATAAGQSLENARLHTELERAMARVAEANRNLLVLDRAKSEFVNVASHELRTPIAAIVGFLGLLRMHNPKLPEDLEEPISAIERSSERLASIVVRLTEALEVQPDRLQLARTLTDVRELMLGVVDDLRASSSKRRLTITAEAPPTVPAAMVDAEKVRVALSNLVRNAIRFTPDHGQIDVHLSLQGGIFVIEVADSGIGVAPSEQERIFDSFATGHDPMTHHSGTFEFGSRGLGLGLYLARSIARAHGGDVTLASRFGAGSTFRMTLPLEANP